MKKLTPAQHSTLVEVATASTKNLLSGMYLAPSYKPRDALLRLGYIRSSGRSGEDWFKPTKEGLEYLESTGCLPPEEQRFAQWMGSPVGQCFLRDLGYERKL